MARTKLPYFNASQHGEGLEGAVNYSNSLVNNFLVPSFLLVLYGLSIYVWSKSGKSLGAGIAFISLFFFLMGIIAQTFSVFGQMTIFIFFIGIIGGIVMRFFEG